jgi:plastocyanin
MSLRNYITGITQAMILCLPGGAVSAAPLLVKVVDRDNLPVPEVAVFLNPTNDFSTQAPPGTTAVMDQVNTRFVPNLLVVQSGTSVEFPNTDTVAHHVYSFSHPNQFKLPLYKGNAHPPVTFDGDGIVILGCNVHDNMLGYIVVVDTPFFAKTDEQGIARFEFAVGEVDAVSVWSPRFKEDSEALSKPLAIVSGEDQAVTFKMEKKLRPPHDQQSEALLWSDY